MHTFAFWLCSPDVFSSPQRVLVSAIIHFFMMFLLLTFMYDKSKAPLPALPFQISGNLFHSSSNWSSNVTSNNAFTLFVPEVFRNISLGASCIKLSSFWEISSFTWTQQRRWSALLKHVLIASNNFFSLSVPNAL